MRTDSSSDKRNKGDRLLKVADFLNQFQSHFLSSCAKKKVSSQADGEAINEIIEVFVGKVTTRDLEAALAFRTLLERLKIVEGEKYVVDEYGRSDVQSEPITRIISENKNEELKNIQKKIQATPDRTKLVFTMLRRCEVWTCKLVAQDHLLTPTQLLPEAARIKTYQCCFSPLMNLPSSKYFSKILPSIVVEDKDQLTLASAVTEAAEINSKPSKSSIPAFHRHNKCVKCCTLALPPNKHTWEAYARLATMASLIGDDELSGCDRVNDNQVKVTSNHQKELSLIQCFKSPLCVYDLNRCKKGKSPSQNHQYSFSPSSDLVPLWIRAQRNTQALRQLILLFEVIRGNGGNANEISDLASAAKGSNDKVTAPEEPFQAILGTSVRGGGKHLTVDQAEKDSEKGAAIIEGDSVKFKALFRGNPTNIRTRGIEICEHVDHLIEWAVVNQSIFTYRHIKKHFLTAPLRKQDENLRKRQRENNDFPHRTVISKKHSRDIDEKQNLFELHQTCQSYLLRWFARRNRNALTIVFSKHLDYRFLDIGCSVNRKVLSQAEPLRDAGVSSKVQEYMQNFQTGKFYPEDRTLSRIDRRLFYEGRYNGSGSITCQSQISNLLQTLSRACPENQKSHKKLIDAAIEDLERLFQTFSPMTIDESDQDGVYQAALKLINPSKGCTKTSLVDLLKSTPAPWVEKCCKCKKAESTNLITCFNCEQVFHEKCSSSTSGSSCTTVALKVFIHSFPPLHDLFKLKRPKNLHYPDFSNSENQWIRKTIRIERKIKGDGKVRKLGISFDHTEDCLKALEAIESDACSLMELMKSEEYKIRDNNLLAPLRIAHKGCLIREVHNELCGGRAGLKIGDIIIGVELVEYAHAKDEQKYGGPCKFDLSGLSNKDRLALLKVESSKLNLIILRPPINIVEIAITWYTGTKRINKKILDVLRGMKTFRPWYCGECTQSRTYEESRSVFLEATYCRAVIRRIGMESYAQPFLEENQTCQSGYFCLRRLDSIMTHIMRVESKDEIYDYAPRSFFSPSSANSTSQRIAWASEKLESRPMELLCEAMKALLNSLFPGKIHLNTQRSALLRHFLLTFGSWCVGGTVKSNSYSRLIGPPEIFQYSRAPWFEVICSVCFSQPATCNKTCNNQFCLSGASRGEQQNGIIDKEEVEKTGKDMKEYSTHASLVGKSFLVLPSDPLVDYVSRIVHIDHENRPVEFVVASYLPSRYHDAVVNGRQKDRYDQFDEKDGIYHLLPVVSSRQQTFLLERCKMRNQNEENNSGCSWTSLDVLNLDGVARYSPAALRNKLKESSEIRLVIDNAIVQQVCTSSSSSNSHLPNHHSVVMMNSPSLVADFALEMQDKLLETLLKGNVAAEVVRELLSTEAVHYQSDATEGDDDRTKWKIVERNENSDSLEFGLSRLQPGLLSINPVRASWKILKLQNISEEKYSLYYSDFLFYDKAGKEVLQKKLYPPNISPFRGSQSSRNGSIKTFILSQEDVDGAGADMFGWGFEILKWANERILRVGRVRRESPADRAGLKTHDIFESINGVRFTRFRDISSLVSSILGASDIKIRMPENLDRSDEISMILSTIKAAKIKLSPVTFYILRPSSIGCRATLSGMSASRSAMELQRPIHVPPQVNSGGSQSRSSSHPESIPRNVYAMNLVLQKTYNSRSLIEKWDFYRPAKNGTILTTAEVSVFLESLTNRTWKLGVRLLMPRYDIRTIAEQIRTIFSWTPEAFVRIPVVKGRFYQKILNLDYGRMNCTQYPEIGPIILEEEKDNIKYKYRSPRRPLPIDRSIEIEFGTDQQDQQRQWSPPHQQSQRQNPMPDHNMWHPHQNKHYGHNNKYQHVGVQQNPSQIGRFDRNSSGDNGSSVSHQDNKKNGNQHQDSALVSYVRSQDTMFVPSRHEEIQNNLIVDLEDESDGLSGLDEPTISTDEPSLLMYTNEISQRRNNANPEHTNALNPRSSFPGQYTERIHGGGNSDTGEPKSSTIDHQNSYLYLCDVPRSQWKGKAVYTFVQTASKGSVCSDALLVGFVRRHIEVNSHDEEILDKVEIEAYYLSGTGYFERTKMHQSDSDEVWVVDIDQDCEEARVIAKLHLQNKFPSDYREESQRTTLKNTISDKYRKENEQSRMQDTLDEQKEESEWAISQAAAASGDCRARGKEASTIANKFDDALCLGFDRTPCIYNCEEQHLGMNSSVKYHSGCHECSLCSLPFERYLVCNLPAERKKYGSKSTFPRSLGCSLMSDVALTEQPSHLDLKIPGRLGEGKIILLKIARLIPMSMKRTAKDWRQQVDPLRSFRIFDNDTNYTIWKGFVVECTCTDMLAQALVILLASIQRTKLPDWWSRMNAGWSTPYAIMAELSLSELYLHIYVLDVALSDIISRSLKESSDLQRSHDANLVQKQRMKRYWERAMTHGYKAFEGSNKDKCYHCNDGGHLLCCELCPNVQHHECCDPKLSNDVKLDHWLCDSCINDIDSYEGE